ncbi:MAG: 4'-phosphopantetheinyl transferase superfamily protein [Alistipes sp.]|nr:4'-phosphopantetheinyl transferase superfamily protein [Alistipes sp.]
MKRENNSTSQPDVITFGEDGNLLIIGHIAPLQQLEVEASDCELQSVEQFSSYSRRAERLSWRMMLRRVVGRSVAIEYSSQGAPLLSEEVVINNCHYKYISVSHCRDMVAIMLSQQPCGVDIEQRGRDFERVSSRYITAEEQGLSDSAVFNAVAWCAKEALYKMAHREGLDFRCDICITAVDFENNRIFGRVGVYDSVEMQILWPDDEHIVVGTMR